MILGPLTPGTSPFAARPTHAAGDPPVEDRPLLGRVLSYDSERALQEIDGALAGKNFRELASLCGSSQLKVRQLLEQRADRFWNLDLSQADPKHAGELYRGLASQIDPPDDGGWFLGQFGPFLEKGPGDVSFNSIHYVLRHLSLEATEDVARGVLDKFRPGERLAWPHVHALVACCDNGWQPDAGQQERLRQRLEDNLGAEPLVSTARPPLQIENVLLMELLGKIPASAGWTVHGRPLSRELLDRLLGSPERGLYDTEGAPNRGNVPDSQAFGQIIARDPALVRELLEEAASGSARTGELYMLLAAHQPSLELAARVKPPEGAPFDRIRLHVADKVSAELRDGLPQMEPAAGLEATRCYRELWSDLGNDQLMVRNLGRLQIPEPVGRLALDQDFLVAAVASQTSPTLQSALLERVPGLSFPEDTPEALELSRLRALLFSHQLRQTDRQPAALLGFLANQGELSPNARIEWTQAWGELDGPQSGTLHRLRIDPATAGVLLERDRTEQDLAEIETALQQHFAEPDEVRGWLGAGEVSLFNRFMATGTSREDARTALDSYRALRNSGLDEEAAFMQAAGRLLGAPNTPGGGLSVNHSGLVVGGTFLRKRSL